VISENERNYENVVIRNEQEIGINNFGLDYMVGLEEEIERLNENNQAMQEEMARTWKKLDEKENIIKEVREYINENEDYFYNYPLVSREHLLGILDKGKE